MLSQESTRIKDGAGSCHCQCLLSAIVKEGTTWRASSCKCHAGCRHCRDLVVVEDVAEICIYSWPNTSLTPVKKNKGGKLLVPLLRCFTHL